MIMGRNNGNNNYSKNLISPSTSATIPLEVVDTQTLVAKTRDRMLKAIEGQYLYDSSLKDSQAFLLP
jgi:hypothetical protein